LLTKPAPQREEGWRAERHGGLIWVPFYRSLLNPALPNVWLEIRTAITSVPIHYYPLDADARRR
jgi:hypothetical protein